MIYCTVVVHGATDKKFVKILRKGFDAWRICENGVGVMGGSSDQSSPKCSSLLIAFLTHSQHSVCRGKKTFIKRSSAGGLLFKV